MTDGVVRPAKPRGPSPLRRVAFWTGAFAVFYGLALCVLTDSLFLLAIPGLIGLAALGSTGALLALYAPVRGRVPYATDGTNAQGAVEYHRSVLGKRYGILVLLCLAAAASVPVTKSDYVIPLAPMAILVLFLGTRFWFEQSRSVRLAARVADVYGFEFRAPVEKLNIRASGKRSLRLGRPDEGSPKMSAHQPLGKLWPENIEAGVWFAGDDVFGGVALVPGSGELMIAQPLHWDELAGERSRAGAERTQKAQRAGLDRRRV
ncbi:hypothetical protein [Streptomyces sp. WMMB 322]|uniref:hypothetical protein n=1 Tax=Streptomyces sp. WMMB 322 TaxID=1286821 RepID=UPI0006E3602C|nr:hypothetical protein [Streptomyces sp. WMMB 322]SCK33014.1 hypothetical protein H180DRAFT_02661 [Streptomyces sp. WMMB 322]